MLAINQSIKAQLNLQTVDEQIAELADGTQIRLEVVGPVEIHFENRRAMVDAMVLPGEAEVLLGAIPMEEMDVMVDPKQQQLIVNPASPYITKKSLKWPVSSRVGGVKRIGWHRNVPSLKTNHP